MADRLGSVASEEVMWLRQFMPVGDDADTDVTGKVDDGAQGLRAIGVVAGAVE
ncbi:hypothetical protein D9M71_776220 [compost metagenome]